MILNDKQIKQLAVEKEMIFPFINERVVKGISNGLNYFGYDLRFGSAFKIFKTIKEANGTPKKLSKNKLINIYNQKFQHKVVKRI